MRNGEVVPDRPTRATVGRVNTVALSKSSTGFRSAPGYTSVSETVLVAGTCRHLPIARPDRAGHETTMK